MVLNSDTHLLAEESKFLQPRQQNQVVLYFTDEKYSNYPST